MDDAVVPPVLDQRDAVDDDAIAVPAMVPAMHVVELLRGRVAVLACVLDQVEGVEARVVRAHEIEVEPARTGELGPDRPVLLRDDRVVHAGKVELPDERDRGEAEPNEEDARLSHRLLSLSDREAHATLR